LKPRRDSDLNSFDSYLVEDLEGYAVNLPKSAKHAHISKNPVDSKLLPARGISMKDRAAGCGRGRGLGALVVEWDVGF